MINVEKRTNHRRSGLQKAVRAGTGSQSMTAFALIMLVGTASISHAQDHSWKEGFAGCTGTSPFIETMISTTDPDVRPLMKIGEMQAWAIKDENGNPATALTTEDGLTIVGRIIGPQGEDITAALLATVPDPNANLMIDQASLAHTSNTALTPQPNATTPEPMTQDAMTPLPNLQTTAVAPTETTSPALSQLQQTCRQKHQPKPLRSLILRPRTHQRRQSPQRRLRRLNNPQPRFRRGSTPFSNRQERNGSGFLREHRTPVLLSSTC